MIPEIAAALSAVTNAGKMVAGVLKLARNTEVNQAVIELQNAILDLQSKVFAVQGKYDELAEIKRQAEEKLIQYEKWDADADRYELHQTDPGVFVYMLKPEYQGTDPVHWLCPNCFQQRKKSIISRKSYDLLNCECHACGLQICPSHFPDRSG